MKKRACFSFRPRPGDPEQQRAWEILQAVPKGKKTAFVAGAILRSREEEALEQTLRRVLREELRTVSMVQTQILPTRAKIRKKATGASLIKRCTMSTC